MIKWVYEVGLLPIVSTLCDVFAAIVPFVFSVIWCKKFGIGRIRAVVLTLLASMGVALWSALYVKVLPFLSVANTPIILLAQPVFLLLVSLCTRIKWKYVCDFTVISNICFSVSFGKVNCTFVGCCQGYPSAFGIYNVKGGLTLFPVQIFELLTMIIIGIFLMSRLKGLNYKCDGLNYPIFFILFGITRFFFEFMRNNSKLWLGISEYGFTALFMVLVGVVSYVLIKRFQSAKPELADESPLITEKSKKITKEGNQA